MDVTSYEGIHRGGPGLTEIADSGIFGGVFAGPRGGMYGSHEYLVTSPRHLTDYALNYETEGAWEAALEISGSEELAEIIMTAGCETEDPEDGYDAQRMRGQLAAKLGYTSVEMIDETGRCALCLPGCKIEAVSA